MQTLPFFSQKCGPERDRTAGLLIANEALYQLSYRPLFLRRLYYMNFSGNVNVYFKLSRSQAAYALWGAEAWRTRTSGTSYG